MARAALVRGSAVVIGLQMTGEAATQHSIKRQSAARAVEAGNEQDEEEGGDDEDGGALEAEEDFVSGPYEMLVKLIDRYFPRVLPGLERHVSPQLEEDCRRARWEGDVSGSLPFVGPTCVRAARGWIIHPQAHRSQPSCESGVLSYLSSGIGLWRGSASSARSCPRTLWTASSRSWEGRTGLRR